MTSANYEGTFYTPNNVGASASPSRKTTSPTLSERHNKKPIIHQEFEDAAEYTKDPSWRDILLLAARGVFNAKRIVYEDGYLIQKDANLREKMPTDPERLAKAFIKFHQKYDDLLTKKDMQLQESKHKKNAEEMMEVQWTTCGKKMKRSLLIAYADAVTATDSTTEERDQLVAILLLAESLGMMSEKRAVVMKNNTIIKVRSILYDDAKQQWYLNEDKYPAKHRVSNKKEPVEHLEIKEGWEEVLERHNTAIEKSTRKRKPNS